MVHIFRSDTIARTVAAFTLNPDHDYGADEIAAMSGVTRPAVLPALRALEEDGLITVRSVGKKHLFRAVTSHPLYPELRSISLKTLGAQDEIRRLLSDDSTILAAAIFGSFARGSERPGSDIDLLIIIDDAVGDERDYELAKEMASVGLSIGRDVHLSIYRESEWRSLRATSTVSREIAASDMIVLKGDPRA